MARHLHYGNCQLCCRLLPVPPLGNLAGERCLHQSFAKGFASDAGAVPPSSDLPSTADVAAVSGYFGTGLPPDIGWPGLMMATRHRLCHDAQRRLKQINPIRKCPLAIAPRQPRSFLHLQGGAIEGRHHGLHQPVPGNVSVRTFVWFGEEGSRRNPVRRKRTPDQRALDHLEIESV